MPTSHYGQPRYRVIAAELQRRIETGEISPGALLPPESTLTTEFKASRGTIRQAIAALREDGLVVTEHGRGTHAAYRQPAEQTAVPTDTETQDREVPATEDLAQIFDVPPGTALYIRQTVERDGGRAQSVTRSYRLSKDY